ncbi:unnamed protein product [Paramecium primaurelia]|uniref:Uncharacterized protein n=1 Tax=Paramecium primaurelia TaxID=5886 RepID=A0A8S1PBS3_PARPR|nr:unnamed protein product [Paramecium primaurelia]
MGCSQAKSKQQILVNLNQSQSAQNEAMNFEKNNNKYNISKNPIIMRRTERKNKMSQSTTPCTSTLIQ